MVIQVSKFVHYGGLNDISANHMQKYTRMTTPCHYRKSFESLNLER